MTTRSIHASRSARTAITLALATALLPLSAAIAEGYYYEATTVDQLENGKERSRSQVRGWIDGPAAKIEFADQKGTMFKPGSYLLTKDAGRTLYLVDPKEKAYSRWDLEAMLASSPETAGDIAAPEDAVRGLLPQLLANEPYVITHGAYRDQLTERRARVDAAFDRMEQS